MTDWLARLRAYLNGIREFRLDATTHYDYPLIESYDRGREHAHKLTRRRWDQTYY
jgi:hypothetical protein